jgi:hypothetical protein
MDSVSVPENPVWDKREQNQVVNSNSAKAQYNRASFWQKAEYGRKAEQKPRNTTGGQQQ